MDKIYVVFWTQSGNTQAMAEAIGEGIKEAGKECAVVSVSDMTPQDLESESVFALGCPAMGAEVLEAGEFDPMFTECEGALSGTKIALFGSYGWGTGDEREM